MGSPWRWALAGTAAFAGWLATLVGLLALSFDADDLAYAAVPVALGAVPLAIGWLVLRHDRTRGRGGAAVLGAYLCWMAVLGPSTAVTDLWGHAVERRPGVLPVVGWLVPVMSVGWTLLYLIPALLILHFPDGRLPGPRWRVVRRLMVGAPIVFVALALVSPDPYPPPFEAESRFPWVVTPELAPVFAGLVGLTLASIMGGLVAAATSVVVRRRRTTDPVVRAQLRWISLAGMALPATLLLCWLSYLLLDGPDLVVVGLAVTWVALPTAVWIAIVHHDLYDVDRIAATAVTWTAVMGLLLLGWTAVTVLMGTFLGGDRPVAVAAVTAALVLALLPFRSALGRAVDRRLYPARARARAAIDDLLAAVRSGEAVPEQLEAVLGRALATPELRVTYLVPGADGARRASGEVVQVEPAGDRSTADGRSIAIRAGGREIAWIDGLRPERRAIVAELVEPIGLVAELARLRIEVTSALHETEESRRRLQSVGYEERRRLEQNLHDGAQQRLVSLGMSLRIAQRHLDPGDGSTRDLIDAAVAELGTAVGELRHLAHGLRPACLDDGLGPALAPLAISCPVPIRVAVSADALPDVVSTTAYYVVMEAVTNAIKHAEASEIDVNVAQRGGQLAVQVVDDGRGGADRAGAGWSGLADRVIAAGGSFALHSPPGDGTRLEVLLPCA